MSTEKATLRDGSTLAFIPSVIGEGTMKEVYFSADRASVLCFYRDPKTANDPVRLQRLESILGKYNPTLMKSQGGAAPTSAHAAYYAGLFCWPTGVVVRPRFGIVTPTYPQNFFFGSGPAQGREKNGAWFINRRPRALIERHAPQELGTWLNFFKICVQMARAVNCLHTTGLAHSDLSPNNILVDPSAGASIVIDIDSLVVPGKLPPDVLGTPRYIAPEVLATCHLPLNDPSRKIPSARTDEHALAVLIYQYLLGRHPLEGKRIPHANSAEEQDRLAYGREALYAEHPRDAANRPEDGGYLRADVLGPQLKELFERSFVEGLHAPHRRPTAYEWLKGLIKTWDLLHPCGNAKCPSQWFVLYDRRRPGCPFCGHKPTHPIPMLKLRAEGRPGQWMPDGELVAYHNWSLMKWHAYSKIFPGPEADRTPQAYCVWHQGQWLLVNQSLGSLTSPAGNRVPVGQAVALVDGAQIRLSQEPNGRIAEVQILKP